MDVYTTSWKRIPGANMGYYCSTYEHKKPDCLEEMLEASRKLSSEFNHARVDFYIANNRIYFGEITFTNGAGYDRFEPDGFDLEMGSWLHVGRAVFQVSEMPVIYIYCANESCVA